MTDHREGRTTRVATSILRKIVDDDHTILNDGGYLVMEADTRYPDEINDRIVDLTDEEFTYLKTVLSVTEQPIPSAEES